jgi:DHA2 family multidrug resistance protein-like MFS transporter
VGDGLPAGVPAEAADAVRDTLGGATGVAQRLPGDLGTAVLDVAHSAFVSGMQTVAAISIALAVGVAILAFVALRHVPPRGEVEGDGPTEPADDAAPTPGTAPAPAAAAQA